MAEEVLYDLSTVPLDVATIIIEHAASSNKASALSLSLVCREVQQWTDPWLFRHIVERSKYATNSPLRFPMDCSERHKRAMSYVLSFTATHPSNDLSGKVLKHCPNLVSLCFWTDDYWLFPAETDDLEIYLPNLRRMSFYPDKDEVKYSASIFSNVTHLDISYASHTDWPADGIFPPNLTHLSLNGTDSDGRRLLATEILSRLPDSLKLLLLMVDGEEDLDEVTNGVVDDRIVACWDHRGQFNGEAVNMYLSSKDAMHYWCGGKVDEEDSFWVTGMRIVVERRRRKAEGRNA